MHGRFSIIVGGMYPGCPPKVYTYGLRSWTHPIILILRNTQTQINNELEYCLLFTKWQRLIHGMTVIAMSTRNKKCRICTLNQPSKYHSWNKVKTQTRMNSKKFQLHVTS